jgi:fucose permease
MIMAVSGGAFLPPLMGMVSTNVGVKASFLVLVLAMVYLVSAGVYALKK